MSTPVCVRPRSSASARCSLALAKDSRTLARISEVEADEIVTRIRMPYLREKLALAPRAVAEAVQEIGEQKDDAATLHDVI